MSVWGTSHRDAQLGNLFPRPGGRDPLGGRGTSRRNAFTHSVMWASTRVRADLVSSLPIDVYRKVLGTRVELPKPPILVAPSGDRIGMDEWMYSSQVDLDTVGNAFGDIIERDGNGLPARIDLVPRDEVEVRVRDGEISYLFAGEKREARNVWHERQYTMSGMALGLSPLAYIAMTMSQFSSAREFAMNWFDGGAIPTAMLKNDNQTIDPKDSDVVKARFKLAIENGEVFVAGKDWDYKIIEAQGNQATFIDTMKFTGPDIARFMGVPGDIVDVASESGNVTYANVTQRFLQLLVINMGPVIGRRENALSRLVSGPRFVRINRKALLAMDPETEAKVRGQQVKDGLLVYSEARALDEREPYTDEQMAEFEAFARMRNPQNEETKRGA